MQIKRPDWEALIYHCRDGLNLDLVTVLNKCWDAEAEPINKILAEGVEVTTYTEKGLDFANWVAPLDRPGATPTHKALLINIQPIQKETAEDVLRDCLDNGLLTTDQEFRQRAKAVLGD